MFDEGNRYFLLMVRDVFLCGYCVWESPVCKVRLGVCQPLIFLVLMAWLVLSLLNLLL